jgi:hypothetical protein
VEARCLCAFSCTSELTVGDSYVGGAVRPHQLHTIPSTLIRELSPPSPSDWRELIRLFVISQVSISSAAVAPSDGCCSDYPAGEDYNTPLLQWETQVMQVYDHPTCLEESRMQRASALSAWLPSQGPEPLSEPSAKVVCAARATERMYEAGAGRDCSCRRSGVAPCIRPFERIRTRGASRIRADHQCGSGWRFAIPRYRSARLPARGRA